MKLDYTYAYLILNCSAVSVCEAFLMSVAEEACNEGNLGGMG